MASAVKVGRVRPSGQHDPTDEPKGLVKVGNGGLGPLGSVVVRRRSTVTVVDLGRAGARRRGR